MLENIAKLQQQNHSLQKELEILKSQHAEKEVRDIDISNKSCYFRSYNSLKTFQFCQVGVMWCQMTSYCFL